MVGDISKTLKIEALIYEIRYNLLSGKCTVLVDGNCCFSKSLILPFGRYNIPTENQKIILSAWIFPFFKMSIKNNDTLVCSDIFPKHKRRSVILALFAPFRILIALFISLLS